MGQKPVICLGCAFWDTIFKVDRIPGHGTKLLPERAVQAASGMATAAAVTVARLGAPVELWARVGDDSTADAFLRQISREGVETRWVRRVPGAATAFSTILVDPAGERLVVPYTDPSLDDDPAWLPLDRVARAGAVLVDVRWVEGAEVLLREARRQGVPAILDADIAPADILRRLLVLADHVLFSEPALMSIASGSDHRAAIRDIASHCDARIIGVTLGERGAVVFDRREPETLKSIAAPSVRALDTLNAGDVWHGTYAYGLVSGWPLERTIALSNLAAAMKCEHFGGRLGSPTLAQLLERSRVETAGGERDPVP